MTLSHKERNQKITQLEKYIKWDARSIKRLGKRIDFEVQDYKFDNALSYVLKLTEKAEVLKSNLSDLALLKKDREKWET